MNLALISLSTCLVFLMCVHAGQIEEVHVNPIENPKVCAIEKTKGLTGCFDNDGKLVPMLEKSIVPFLTECELLLNDSKVLVTCLSNGEMVQSVISERQKRGFTEIGIGLGAPFGPVGAAVGGAIGFVGDIICMFVCKSEDPPPPNHPPSFTKCASLDIPTPIYATEGETTAHVSWTDPEGTDPDGDEVTITSYPESFTKDKEYSEGNYVVYFSATSNGGLSATCALAFEVKVKTCLPPRWPEHGYQECSSMTLGSTCTFTCDEGYKLEPERGTIQCTDTGFWNPSNIIKCVPKVCNSKPIVENGDIRCRHEPPKFGDMCAVICNEGYRVKGFNLLDCDKTGEWGTLPVCEDKMLPRFVSCPDDKQVNIDATNNTARVSWDMPIGSDNSKKQPLIEESHHYSSGQRFRAGSHTVKYTIQDDNGNIGDSCVFSITVQTISCTPPSLNVAGGQHMMYKCPNLYRLGAECHLSCRSGYPLGGVDKIQCLNDDGSDPPVLTWQWDKNGLEPFCKETDCPDLPAPTNGALACSLWDHGHMCQLQCQDGFDVPIIRDGMFVCGKSDGHWRPDENVPDCNPKRNAHQMHLKSDLYYYTGKCNSSATNLLQIKDNFVKALNTSKYHEQCVGVPECQAKFVNITCGSVTSRRRRETALGDFEMVRRSTGKLAYSITFDMLLPYKSVPGKGLDEVFSDNENMLYDMIDAIQTEVDAGHFDIHMRDLRLDSDSLGPGAAELSCPKGTLPKQETGSCSGCPTGRYFSDVTGDCQYCPIGTYQDEADSTDCKTCSSNTTTTDRGSINKTQCLEYCKAGSASPSGLGPCAACPSNSYQPNDRATSCLPCDQGQRSLSDGSTSKANCQAYDVQLQKGTPANIYSNASIASMTFTSWIKLSNKSDTQTILQIRSSDGSFNQSFQIDDEFMINTNGKKQKISSKLERLTWTHVGIVVSSRGVDVYLDGMSVYTASSAVARVVAVEADDAIEINADALLSALKIFNRKVQSSEIMSMSKSCSNSVTGAVYSLDDIKLPKSASIVIPSKCDAVDECKSSPCGRHECFNEIGDYICHCHDEYTGKQCSTPPDFCLDNTCRNGASCVIGSSNFTCACPYGYSGLYCEIKAVDGGWSNYTTWTACTKSCGGGKSLRTRRCDSPSADPEGKPCVGMSQESRDCNIDKCPECSRLHRSYGVNIDCNKTTDPMQCTISCRPGLYFAVPPLPYYECGSSTGFKWSHQNNKNPTGRLPSCSNVKPPTAMSVSFDGTYDGMSCSESTLNIIIQSLESKIASFPCTKSGMCTAEISSNSCSLRNKRSSGNSITVKVGLHSTVSSNGNGFHLEDVLSNRTAPSAQLSEFMKQTLELEKTAQQIFNNSVDFFSVMVDGVKHTHATGTSGLLVTPTVQCPSGTIKLDVFCAECPVGSYSDGVKVTLCQKGQYQDEAGQSTCKQCPNSKTTAGIGSIHVSECIDHGVIDDGKHSHTHGDNDKDSEGATSVVQIAVGVSVAVAFVVFAAVAAVFAYKYVGKRYIILHTFVIILLIITIFLSMSFIYVVYAN